MKTLLSAIVAAAMALAAVEVNAEGAPQERQVSLLIESKSLAEALDQWAQQTGFQIFLANWEMAKKVSAPRLHGKYSARDSLDRLLEGTPWMGVWTTDKTVTIREKTNPIAWQAGPEQPATMQEFVGDGIESHAATTRSGDTAESQLSSNSDAWRRGNLEEILVTGTHIHGVENSTVPVTVLNRADITATGLSTTTRLMESVPQNFALVNQSGVFTPGTENTADQGSSVNLRGIGQGTTLILLNGRRLAPGFGSTAVDISALPLSAIDRVEIMTDGASALYGSDAIGGVVNFVLRDDFEGAETSLHSGWADGSDEYRISQAFGHAWGSGNALLSAEYYNRELLWARDRDFVPSDSDIGSLLPKDETYSVLFSGRQEVADSVALFADGIYMKRRSNNFGGRLDGNESHELDNPQVNATAGVDWAFASNWRLEFAGTYARNTADSISHGTERGGRSQFTIRQLEAKADGSLWHGPGGDVSLAIGAEWRDESYDAFTDSISEPGPGTRFSTESAQIVRGAFAEVYVPLVGAGNAVPGVQRLELSAAGRLDDYSNFGSSFDPQAGLMWEPVKGLRLRATHGTSYKAPNLNVYSSTSNAAVALFDTDPAVPAGISYQFLLAGADVASLSAQESESSAFGLELTPEALPGFRLGLNYYKIRYTARIAEPSSSFTQMLVNPAAFGGLVVRNPSVDQVNSAVAFANLGQGFLAFNEDFSINENFDPDSIDVLIDGRVRNLSETDTSGLDVSLQYDFRAGEANVHLGLSGTYIDKLEQRVTPTSNRDDTIDTIFNPPDWKLRAFAGWQRAGWSANVFVNHTDSYSDNRTDERVAISSWTTVDARVAFDFSGRFADTFLDGVIVAASAQNLFDRAPPHTQIVTLGGFDMGFDPTNASPLGRLIALEVSKTW